ncbi:TniQ family protein [Streptomyces xiamenensis]|uniref:TniQ family protein n=1 Tax=Streptomyces xiamenensis TaxID=408015 RepID=UPI0036E90578
MAGRTLPIRLPPLPGEALDSWLEALSARLDTTQGETLHHLGFPARTQHRGAEQKQPPDWTIMLRDQETNQLADSSGLPPETITQMTLARYFPHAIQLDLDRRHVDRRTLWGRGSGSRFCPDCLHENYGRWQLSWRLGWAFACTRHYRLLADCCPACERIPRHRPHSGRSVPRLGACGNAPILPGQPHTRGCGFELQHTPTLRLADDHPALSVQAQLQEIIATGQPASFGAYQHSPQPARQALMDIRAVAQHALADLAAEHLAQLLPDDLTDAYLATLAEPAGPHRRAQAGFLAPTEPASRPGFMAPSRAVSTAVAATLALRILGSPDVREGGVHLRAIHQARREHLVQPIIPSSIEAWGRSLSPVLEAIHLAAIAPGFRPSAQLRHRTSAALPRRPTASTRTIQRRARSIPSAFWPAWTIRLISPAQADQHNTGPALATSLLVIDSPQTLQTAAERLGAVIDGHQASLVLRRLDDHPQWHQLMTVLNRLADHLDTHPAPIDYERRRSLDYTSLLPPERWQDICRQAGVRDPKGRLATVARHYLFQRISGLPTGAAPGGRRNRPVPNTSVDRFTRVNTPELKAVLDSEARAFLAGRHIHDEPLTWQPPGHLFEELDLPGPDLAHVDIPRLHHLVRRRRTPIQHAAAELGISDQAVRHLLDTHPAPPPTITPTPGPTATPARRHKPPLQVLASALTSRYGLQRLERFAAVASHRTLTEATLALGISGSTVIMQIQRLEKDLGGPLISRANRAGPMRLTRLGRRVVTAVESTTVEEMTRFVRQGPPDMA